MGVFSWFFRRKKENKGNPKLEKLHSKLQKHGVTQSTIMLVFQAILDGLLSFDGKNSDVKDNKKFQLNLGKFIFATIYISYEEISCRFFYKTKDTEEIILFFTYDLEKEEFLQKQYYLVYKENYIIADDISNFIVRLFSSHFQFVGKEVIKRKNNIEVGVSNVEDNHWDYLANNEKEFIYSIDDKIKKLLDDIQIASKTELNDKKIEAIKQLKTIERLLLFIQKKIEKKEENSLKKQNI